MIVIDYITPIAQKLSVAAASNSTVSMVDFHNLFDKSVSDRDRYDTLEAASRALCNPTIAIYSALLAKSQTNCPGNGFYEAFRNIRPNEFRQFANQTLVQDLELHMQLPIVHEERNRVYQHALANAYR